MQDSRTPGIRPRPTPWRRLDAFARRAFPAACTALLLLLAGAPFGVPGGSGLRSAAALGCVFFWSLVRPASMTPPAVFLLGLLCDLLGLSPPGVTVLVLLVAHGLAVRWRPVLAHRGLAAVWPVFAAVAAGASALEWALTGLLTLRLPPPGTAVLQALLAAGSYPVFAALFVRAHRGPAAPELA